MGKLIIVMCLPQKRHWIIRGFERWRRAQRQPKCV